MRFNPIHKYIAIPFKHKRVNALTHVYTYKQYLNTEVELTSTGHLILQTTGCVLTSAICESQMCVLFTSHYP